MAKGKTKKGLKGLAAKADKYDCYQQSVQEPELEVEMFVRVFHEAYGRRPQTLREDFCGTFMVSCEWARSHSGRRAWAVDLCKEALQWGRENNLSKLKPAAAERVQLLQQDVRESNSPPVDVLAAENFSFWIFRTRQEMQEYLQVAYNNLADQGVMVMDMMGGQSCYESEVTEKRTIVKGKKGFKYHWEHVYHNPVTSHSIMNIHFKFGDGSKMKKAFEYEWRFWTIPEIREMLEIAGFRKTVIYWDEADEDEDSRWIVTEEIENDDCWICYIVAVK